MHYDRWRATGELGGPGSTVQRNAGLTCRGPKCEREAKVKGLCLAHYQQDRKFGELKPINPKKGANWHISIEERIERDSGPEDANGCRIWTDSVDAYGYPVTGYYNGTRFAHRVAYMIAAGVKLPSFIPVHHTCGNTLCVAPAHLRPVTPVENNAEMLERRFYIDRIASLEDALREADPDHPLLEVAGK